jgi:hypothetical protein
LRRVDEGNYLRDHPTATDHVERFARRDPVEVIAGAVTELTQSDSLTHPVTMPTQVGAWLVARTDNHRVSLLDLNLVTF